MRDVRPRSAKPLIVKLTPNCADVARVAQAAEAAGADAVSLINTLRAYAPHPREHGAPWLGGGTGGLSGPAVRAVALAQVAAVARRVAIPIVGMGGVSRGRHARDLLDAGARWSRSARRASATRSPRRASAPSSAKMPQNDGFWARRTDGGGVSTPLKTAGNWPETVKHPRESSTSGRGEGEFAPLAFPR